MGMTVKQLVLFSQLAAERNRTVMVTKASALRVAFHADKKQYNQFLEELNDDG